MINKNQKLALEPIAIVLGGIASDLENKEDEEIVEMYEACEAATTTNCWVYTYEAAQYLRPKLLEQIERRHLTQRVPDAGDSAQ